MRSVFTFQLGVDTRNVKLAGNSILDIGHSNVQCPISNIQLTSNVLCPISDIQLTSRSCGNIIFFDLFFIQKYYSSKIVVPLTNVYDHTTVIMCECLWLGCLCVLYYFFEIIRLRQNGLRFSLT